MFLPNYIKLHWLRLQNKNSRVFDIQFFALHWNTRQLHVLAYLFSISRPFTSIFRIFILQLHSGCKSSPDSCSYRMHVKCIVPALSPTPLFVDATNCGLLPEITVAWTPKPFPSLKTSTKKGIPSPAQSISPILFQDVGCATFRRRDYVILSQLN